MTSSAEKADKAEKGSTAQYTARKQCGLTAKKGISQLCSRPFFSTCFALFPRLNHWAWAYFA